KVVRHRGDPVLAWAIGNVVMESDANANIKPNKKKSSNKIDPAAETRMYAGLIIPRSCTIPTRLVFIFSRSMSLKTKSSFSKI
ncbi:terminase large subunit, partial [Salmonella enterica subsp. enterica serovar Kentucky]|nr:terminase large subunit [Salmonella enterica subsp. enterica serovar Kentucky]